MKVLNVALTDAGQLEASKATFRRTRTSSAGSARPLGTSGVDGSVVWLCRLYMKLMIDGGSFILLTLTTLTTT
jgi:hypothetical protein